MKVGFGDTVQIDHPEVVGTGKAYPKHDGKGANVVIIQAHRRSDGKNATVGKTFNCLLKYLTVIEKGPEFIIEHDGFMAELFESEERRNSLVVTPQFVGNW